MQTTTNRLLASQRTSAHGCAMILMSIYGANSNRPGPVRKPFTSFRSRAVDGPVIVREQEWEKQPRTVGS